MNFKPNIYNKKTLLSFMGKKEKFQSPPFYTTPKPEFTSDEKELLSTMAGKTKKQYVKVLKEKYSDQTRAVFK